MAELLPGFFLSGGEVAEDLDRLKALGITSILNCAPQEVRLHTARHRGHGYEGLWFDGGGPVWGVGGDGGGVLCVAGE